MCNSKTSLTCKTASLILIYITGLSLFHQAQCSWARYNVVCAHVNFFTLPGKLKRCFSITENSGWMEKHPSSKCWLKKCQGTSFHCPQEKPTEEVWLLRSIPQPHYCVKGQWTDFFTQIGTNASLSTKTCNLVLCFWNDCLQPLHHDGEKKCSCCLAALPLHNSQDTLELCTSTSALLGWMFPEELHFCEHAKLCNLGHMKHTQKNSTFFSFIHSSSGHRNHSLPLLCSTLG